MKRIMLSILLIFCIGIGLLGCKQQQKTVSQQQQETNKTVTEHNIKEDFLNQKIANMTVEQKVGQLFSVHLGEMIKIYLLQCGMKM